MIIQHTHTDDNDASTPVLSNLFQAMGHVKTFLWPRAAVAVV